MAEPVKKYSVRVSKSSASSPTTPANAPPLPALPKKPGPPRASPTAPQQQAQSRGPPPATGAAAAAFAAQQQRQQNALLRQQQLYAQQRAQQQLEQVQEKFNQQYGHLPAQQRAQLWAQYQARQQQRILQAQQAQMAGQVPSSSSGRTTTPPHSGTMSQPAGAPLPVMSAQPAGTPLPVMSAQPAGAPLPVMSAQVSSPQTELRTSQHEARHSGGPAQLGAIAAAVAASVNSSGSSSNLNASSPLMKPPSVPKKPPSVPSKTVTETPSSSNTLPKYEPPKVEPTKLKGTVVDLDWPKEKTPFEKPDESSLILFDENDINTGKPKIKAASIEKLVEKATHPKSDPAMQKVFLLTYRSMLSPSELLNLLELRYSMPLPDGNEASVAAFRERQQRPIQLRVCQLLKSWLQNNFHDFETDSDLLLSLRNFIETIKLSFPVGDDLESILNRQISGEYSSSKVPTWTEPPPNPILPAKPKPMFLDLHPIEIARQMTLLESKLFRKILPRELLGLAWSKKDASTRAPNVLAMINRFNNVSNWVVSEVVKPETQKQRVDVMIHFIEIAERCRQLNNFNAVQEIISAMGEASVFRLKTHWEQIPPKLISIYEELKQIMSSDRSYANIRAHLKTCTGSVIPYLGMYLTDLTFIEDGNPDKIGELYNFSKRTFVSNVIQDIQQLQMIPYHLDDVLPIQNFLSSVGDKSLSKEQCYQRSLQILPRGNKPTDAPKQVATINRDDDFGEMEQIPGYEFTESDTPANLRLNANGDPIAATLVKLVERVTLWNIIPDPQVVEALLLTHRAFTSGKDLLELIQMRFSMPLPVNPSLAEKFKKERLVPVLFRALNILKIWTEKFPADFLDDRTLLQSFLKFCETNRSIHAQTLKRMAKTLRLKTIQIKSGEELKQLIATAGTAPSSFPLNRTVTGGGVQLLDFHPEEVARQLTLEDFPLYWAIQASHFFLRDGNSARMNALERFENRADAIRNWTVEEIQQKTSTSRREIAYHFVHIAFACSELKNFHAALAILSGLEAKEFAQNQLLENLPAKTDRMFKQLALVKKKWESYSSVKGSLPVADSTCIPSVVVFLKEISEIDSKETSILQNSDLINFTKLRKIAVILNEFLQFRSNAFAFESVDLIQRYLQSEIGKHIKDDSSSVFTSLAPEEAKEVIRTTILSDGEVKEQLGIVLATHAKEILQEEIKFQQFHSEVQAVQKVLQSEVEKSRKLFSNSSLQPSVSDSLRTNFTSVKEIILDDVNGTVFGWPLKISATTGVKSSGGSCLIYQKNSLDKSSLAVFLRQHSLYESTFGKAEPVILTQIVSPAIRNLANQNGIELVVS